MKTIIAIGAVALLAASAHADPAINWWTIDAGGGSSTGGSFTLSGTIGQFDASTPVTGGSFRLVGGFWGDGGAFVSIPITRNGWFGIAAISVDNAGHASFSNRIDVNGRVPARVKAKRVSRHR